MPLVHISLIEGRTVEQKRAAAKRITEAITETLNCPPEAVKIAFHDLAKEDYASGGVLRYDEKK
ncbi:MAG: 4-oxalocrotonate tautomerase [bacterium]|jgi:4-oxalocrotonate tautomerase